MYDAAGRQRKATNADISLVSPMRPTNVWDTIPFIDSFPSEEFCKTIIMNIIRKWIMLNIHSILGWIGVDGGKW